MTRGAATGVRPGIHLQLRSGHALRPWRIMRNPSTQGGRLPFGYQEPDAHDSLGHSDLDGCINVSSTFLEHHKNSPSTPQSIVSTVWRPRARKFLAPVPPALWSCTQQLVPPSACRSLPRSGVCLVF